MIAEIQNDSVHSKAFPHLINKLLCKRQAMLVSFNRLIALKPFAKPAHVSLQLQQFCQMLMDYVALGHFEVYQCLEDQGGTAGHCDRPKQLVKQLYPRIAQTTRTAVAFNDLYDNKESRRTLSMLSDELSALGEQLADRIELEDRLIAAIQPVPGRRMDA
jgi:regulator of sigma D